MDTNYNGAIIFYDGECGFCNNWVKYVIKYDTNNYFKFCSLHSNIATEYAEKHNFSIENKNSIALLENDEISRKSVAARRIARQLDTSFNWELLIKLFPVPIANAGYIFISKIRHALPGNSCEINPKIKSKFIA